jgi:hypothetical protein
MSQKGFQLPNLRLVGGEPNERNNSQKSEASTLTGSFLTRGGYNKRESEGVVYRAFVVTGMKGVLKK